MAKPWLDSYPSGVPETVDIRRFTSLLEVYEQTVHRFADAPAFVNMGASLSFNELAARTRSLAAWLQQCAELQKGDRIAIMMPNCLQYPIVLFAALNAGLTVVNTNPLYTAHELRHQLTDSGAVAIVVMENFCQTLEQVIGDTQIETVITTRLGDQLPFFRGKFVNFAVEHIKKMVPRYHLPAAISLQKVLAQGDGLTFDRPDLDHHDIAFLQYTGGTTGVAKGAMLSHGNLLANLMQIDAWLPEDLKGSHNTIVTALPMYHIFALTANVLVFMRYGAANLLITNPRDVPAFVKTLSKHPFTAMTGVNTLFNALLNNPDFCALDFSRFKLGFGGGMAVQRAVAERWQAVTGTALIEAYGLTETSPAAVINPMQNRHYSGSIGLPIPSTECVVRDSQGRDLPVGEAGELCIRGPQVMQGYWRHPEATASAIDGDGWFHSGDVARMDEYGYFYLVDRLKDIILVSGFNVYPNEVEDVIALHPGVLEVAAIATPDPHSGEVVKVVVVRKDPALTADGIVAHCKRHLTGYKVPKHVVFKAELPKSNVGKILRRELRNTID